MRRLSPVVVCALGVFLASATVRGQAPDRLVDPRLEARAVALQEQLRCVVCQGESLDESNAPLAEDLRRLIRARIEKGDSNARIMRYLVARYGSFILLRPPFDPGTYALWFGPLFVLLIGCGAVLAVVRRAQSAVSAREPL